MHKWMQTVTTDFAKFCTGQTISSFGSAFTSFALPLLVYDLTRSALGLALASAASFLPWPLFGLLIGAWVDRVDRKRLMILADVLRAAALASIPALAAAKMLSIWWIFIIAFVTATLSVGLEVLPKVKTASYSTYAKGARGTNVHAHDTWPAPVRTGHAS